MAQMSQHYPRVRFHASHGALIIRDGLRICFYMRRDKHEVAREVMRSLDAYLRAVGAQALAWYLDQEGDWQKLDAQAWEDTRRNLLESHGSRFELTDEPSGAPAFTFESYCRRLGDLLDSHPARITSVGFWLPTDFLEEHGPSRVRELALELASLLPFDSGHAGLFLNAMLGYRETEEELSRLCLRYPGMDIGEVESISMQLEGRVKGPSWLTFLGQPVLGQLGGAEGLRSRLSSPGTTVQHLEGERAVITLGPWPEAGDTQAGRTLPEYRELARVLEPHLYHPRRSWSPYFPDDIWQRWERRFLD
jgi:hypothetical protein